MVRINGEDVSADGKILKDYLLENGYNARGRAQWGDPSESAV